MGEPRFARLITMKVKKNKMRKFTDVFESEVASTATRIEGLRRLYLLRPVGGKGEFVALSLWDDEDSAKDYVKSGLNDTYSKKLEKLMKGGERIRKFDVELHVVGQGTRGKPK